MPPPDLRHRARGLTGAASGPTKLRRHREAGQGPQWAQEFLAAPREGPQRGRQPDEELETARGPERGRPGTRKVQTAPGGRAGGPAVPRTSAVQVPGLTAPPECIKKLRRGGPKGPITTALAPSRSPSRSTSGPQRGGEPRPLPRALRRGRSDRQQFHLRHAACRATARRPRLRLPLGRALPEEAQLVPRQRPVAAAPGCSFSTIGYCRENMPVGPFCPRA